MSEQITHAEISQTSTIERIPVNRLNRVAGQVAAVFNNLRLTEAELVEAGVMRVGAAQTAQVEAQYGNPAAENLTADQQSRADALVAQDIQRVR